MEEVWKPIDGYERLYEVSNFGRVRSLEFRNRSGVHRRVKVMSATDNGNGYLIVGLKGHGKKSNRYVHRLVANAFVPNPHNLPVVDHVDHDKTNNTASNLCWVTQRDNVLNSVDLMSKPRSKPMTNTGERYITCQKSDGRYRLTIKRKQIGIFETIEEAVKTRDEILEEA